jgi:type I restriction enzyme S subunit
VGDQETQRLVDVADVTFGYPFSSSEFNSAKRGLPLIRIRDLGADEVTLYTTQKEYPATAEVSTGELLVGMDAEFTPYLWRLGHSLLNQRVCRIEPKSNLASDRVYLRAALMNPLTQLQNSKSATTVIHLNKSDLERIYVRWPHLDQRAAVASILGALDDKIELNRQMNATLEAMARALFQSWFVDFDPVHAKAEGRQPVGMDAATAALFPDSFENSALGPIPKGWALTTANQLFNLTNNRVEPGPEKDHLRYVALDDMKSKSIGIDSFRAGSEVNSSIIEFSQGDILFGSMRPYFHKVGLASFDGITRTTTFVLSPKAEWLRHFGLFQLSTDVAIEYATSASIGTTIPYVTWDALGQYKCILPPEEVLKTFSKEAGALVAQMNVNISTASTLAAMRDVQLPKLLSGELRVGDVVA